MKNLLFLFAVLTSFASCKKEDSANSLPAPSSSGKNFLACKVNGVVHRYSGISNWNNSNGVSFSRFIDRVTIGADEADYNDDLGITVFLPPDSVQSGINYELGGEANRSLGRYLIFHRGGVPPLEFSTTSGSGWVRFSRVDTAVAAGTFAFTAYLDGQQDKDSVVITEGIFDIAAE